MPAGTILKIFTEDDPNTPRCEGYNNNCQKKAKYQIQGETDSYGYETIDWCEDCLKLSEQADEEHYNETRKENHNIAPDGMWWIFIADINDGISWVFDYSKDKGELLVEQEKAQIRWAAHGGLYDEKIQLVDDATKQYWQDRFERRFD